MDPRHQSDTLCACSAFSTHFPRKSYKFQNVTCWNTEQASGRLPIPGSLMLDTVPWETRRLITGCRQEASRCPLPTCTRGRALRAMSSLLHELGVSSVMYKTGVTKTICIISKSDAHIPAEPAQRGAITGAGFRCPGVGGPPVTWPGPPAAAAAGRPGAGRTRRAARAAAGSAGGRRCG